MTPPSDYWREFWVCCLCGGTNTYDFAVDRPQWVPEPECREKCYCEHCGCTWRDRAIGFGVLHGLSSVSGPLSERTRDATVLGLGVGDSVALSASLAATFGYTNSHIDRFPELDIRAIPPTLAGQFRFVTCSDVLEHVLPPVEAGISGLLSLLSSTGFAVISVPVDYPAFKENYPGLVGWQGSEGGVTWTDEDGFERHDESPTFHGGSGDTLELRQWTAETMEDALLRNGFSRLERLPALPSIGVPRIPDMGCWLAYR
jgi:hypothetical protein